MGRTRNLIAEIEDIRKRRSVSLSLGELFVRLFDLEAAFKNYDQFSSEMVRYFPVALVACMEGYFRMVLGEFVEAGDPYLSSAEKIIGTSKIDFKTLRALQGKRITVGELVAHNVSISRLEDVDGSLSTILGLSFLRELRHATNRYAHEIRGEVLAPMLKDASTTLSDVSRTFELRHIICHETASAYPIDREEVKRCYESCVEFLHAANAMLSETLYPGAPLTQTAMNLDAGQARQEATKRLEAILQVEQEKGDEKRRALFQDAQAMWAAYCEAEATLESDQHRGGSMQSMTYSNAAKRLTELRIEELENFVTNRLGL